MDEVVDAVVQDSFHRSRSGETGRLLLGLNGTRYPRGEVGKEGQSFMVHARVTVVDAVDDAAKARLVNALAAYGVEPTGHKADTPNAALVVGFSQVNASLLALLEEEQHYHAGRVLAVALSPAIDPDLSWTLLRHGATDIVVWSDARRSRCR